MSDCSSDASDFGAELKPASERCYPNEGPIYRISTSDSIAYIREVAKELHSKTLFLSNLKLDGFIAELMVRDGLSLGACHYQIDLATKWKPTASPIYGAPRGKELLGYEDHIPFFQLGHLLAYTDRSHKPSFERFMRHNYSIELAVSAPDREFLARSASQPLDWEFIADWAKENSIMTMVFCQFGDNTPLDKAVVQLQGICERGGNPNNRFDISRDLKFKNRNNMILLETDTPGVQVRNMFGGVLSEMRQCKSQAGNVTIEADLTPLIMYNPLVHMHKAYRFNLRNIPSSRPVLKRAWDRLEEQISQIKANWSHFTGCFRFEWKRRCGLGPIDAGIHVISSRLFEEDVIFDILQIRIADISLEQWSTYADNVLAVSKLGRSGRSGSDTNDLINAHRLLYFQALNTLGVFNEWWHRKFKEELWRPIKMPTRKVVHSNNNLQMDISEENVKGICSRRLLYKYVAFKQQPRHNLAYKQSTIDEMSPSKRHPDLVLSVRNERGNIVKCAETKLELVNWIICKYLPDRQLDSDKHWSECINLNEPRAGCALAADTEERAFCEGHLCLPTKRSFGIQNRWVDCYAIAAMNAMVASVGLCNPSDDYMYRSIAQIASPHMDPVDRSALLQELLQLVDMDDKLQHDPADFIARLTTHSVFLRNIFSITYEEYYRCSRCSHKGYKTVHQDEAIYNQNIYRHIPNDYTRAYNGINIPNHEVVRCLNTSLNCGQTPHHLYCGPVETSSAVIIRIQRTVFDRQTSRTLKLFKGFSIARTIKDTRSAHLYYLVSTLCHIGAGFGSGHYLSFVKAAEGWYKVDDQLVKPVNITDMMSYWEKTAEDMPTHIKEEAPIPTILTYIKIPSSVSDASCDQSEASFEESVIAANCVTPESTHCKNKGLPRSLVRYINQGQQKESPEVLLDKSCKPVVKRCITMNDTDPSEDLANTVEYLRRASLIFNTEVSPVMLGKLMCFSNAQVKQKACASGFSINGESIDLLATVSAVAYKALRWSQTAQAFVLVEPAAPDVKACRRSWLVTLDKALKALYIFYPVQTIHPARLQDLPPPNIIIRNLGKELRRTVTKYYFRSGNLAPSPFKNNIPVDVNEREEVLRELKAWKEKAAVQALLYQQVQL